MSKQPEESNINASQPFIRLSDEVKLNIFRFFSKQDAANTSATCRDLYRLSEDKTMSPDQLPFAILDYLKPTTVGSFTFPGIEKICQAVSLCNNRIAVTDLNYTKILQLTRIGQVKCLATLKFADYDYNTLCVLGDNKLVCSRNDLGVKVWDLGKIPREGSSGASIEDIRRGLVRTMVHGLSVMGMVALSEDCFVTADIERTIKVWDLTQPERQECIKDFVRSACARNLVALSATQLACLVDRQIEIYDLTQPDGRECVKVLGKKCIGFTILPNGRIASYHKFGVINIWDLNQHAGHEFVKQIELNFNGSMNNLVCLPDGCLACGLDNKTIKVFDPTLADPKSSVKTLEMDIGSDRYRGSSIKLLTTFEDGRLVAVSDKACFRVFDFNRSQVALEKVGPSCTLL